MTLVVVGRRINQDGLFDTAPQDPGALRQAGMIQLGASKTLSLKQIFRLCGGDALVVGTATCSGSAAP